VIGQSMGAAADAIVQSDIRTMSIECERLGGINMSQGVCDTEVPAPVREAAHAAIEEGFNSYTRYDGLPELRHAIASMLQAQYGVSADPETEIVVSAGSTGAFYCAALALLERGDQVVLFEPYYGYHRNTLLAAGATPVYVRTSPPDWTFEIDALERVIGPRTRGIMINTPANPSGKVFTREELAAIADVASRRNLIVFTDEIYDRFLYDGRRHASPAALPQLANRTVMMSGFSKTFSITGWRVGFAACRADWARPIGHYNDLVYVCAPAPLQIGVARGLAALPPSYYDSLAAEYLAKRDQVCAALTAAGLPPHVPQGAYYVLADASRLPGPGSHERAMFLLRACGVATVPGRAFYHDAAGDTLLRFCFAKPQPDLEEACRRLRALA
jgi:aminotransferase